MGFSSLSIQRKLFLVLGSGIMGFIFYFGVTYYLFAENRKALEAVVYFHLPSVQLADSIVANTSRLRTAATQAALSQNFDGIGDMDELARKVQTGFSTWMDINSEAKSRVEAVQKSFDENYNKLNETLQNVVAGLDTVAKVQGELQSRLSALAEVETQVTQIKESVQTDLNRAVDEAKGSGHRALLVGLGMLCMALIVAVIAFVVMYRIIAALIENNRTLQNTSKRLLEMVEEAQVSSSQLQSTANRQASSSTETVVSMEEMKRLLAQTSKASGDAVEMSEASVVEANDGQGLIQGLKDAMGQIERSNTELEEVNAVVKQIRDKTNVINEIVFKTQLLSFNANIEAARAGQHGLGFAVVATEMGSLADLSGKAAQEINDLLDQSADKVAFTISRTKDKIGNANEISAKCFDFFRLLTDRSGQLKSMVSSISSAAAEQNTGVEYVVNAMNELNQTASETDKMARGISMLADALKAHALTLTSTVESLNGLIRGGRSAESLPHPDDSGDTSTSDQDLKLSA